MQEMKQILLGRREKTGNILFISKRTEINLPLRISKCSQKKIVAFILWKNTPQKIGEDFL